MPADAWKRLRTAFGRVVTELRTEARLTQEKLSFRAGLHRTYISDLEHGLKSPTLDAMDGLAMALGKSPEELVASATRISDHPPTEIAAEIRGGGHQPLHLAPRPLASWNHCPATHRPA